MFSATRRWFRRNRTPLAIGIGVVGAGYLVTQYVLSKINDARGRMTAERIARENLRRRFEQNQEDCTFTVLALLPTATPKILETMNTEEITYEIQHTKSAASKVPAKSVGSLSPPSMSETNTVDDGLSTVSKETDSGVHASQMSLPTASEAAAVPAEAAKEVEQVAQKPRKTKRQLWNDLTISAIARAYTLLYVLGLLIMLTRIQLNLLGRRSYLSSVVALATGTAQVTISLENNDDDNIEQSYGSDFEVNRRYLTFSWWLLNRGWIDIMQRVEMAVRQVFGHLSPRDLISLENFSNLTRQTRTLIEGDGRATWLSFLLPPPDMEEHVLKESGVIDESLALSDQKPQSPTTSQAALRRLLDETADLIESPAFSQVLTKLLDAGFDFLLNQKLATEAFESIDGVGTEGGKVVLLPKILSVLTKQAHAVGNGMPNEYLQQMEGVQDLEAFAAIVYSSNWESEMRDDGIMASAVNVQASEVPGAQSLRGEGSVLADAQASLESVWQRVRPS